MKQSSWRSNVALALCLGSVIVALVMRRYNLQSWYWVIEMVAIVWFFSGLWLGNRLGQLNQSPKAIYQDFREKSHTMPQLPSLMVRGGMILTAVDIPLLFVK